MRQKARVVGPYLTGYTWFMTESRAFMKAFSALNKGQKQAVEAIEGPVMVVAGPGSGKTQILTLRVANILLTTDTAPENILALTFTESAVSQMRSRLEALAGGRGARVSVYTFHGFAGSVIERYPDSFPRIVGSEPATDAERVEILERVIKKTSLKRLRPSGEPLFYLPTIRSAIAGLKRESVSPDNLAAFSVSEEKVFRALPDLRHKKGPHRGEMKGKYEGLTRSLERTKELVRVYRSYEKELRASRRYDFEDMILEVVRALKKDRGLLLELQEEYQYLLADEHQDANLSQDHLLELLASFHKHPNIFVVGDESQAIFRFQGATLGNFDAFQKRYPEARKIVLIESYRSGQNVLDAAQSLMSAGGNKSAALRAARERSKHLITLAELSAPDLERAWVAHEAKTRIKSGTAPEEIAVLYRTNREGEPLRRAFEKEGVPVVIESDQDALSVPAVRSLMAIFEAVESFGNDTKLAPLLHLPFFNLAPLDVYRFFSSSAREKVSLFSLLKDLKKLKSARIEDPDAFLRLFGKLSRWKQRLALSNPLSWAEEILQESGLLDGVIRGQSNAESLAALRSLMGAIGVLLSRNHKANLAHILAFIKLHEKHGLSLSLEAPGKGQAVRLMTAHRAKGLEFREVYITNLVEGVWGNRRAPHYFRLPPVLREEQDLDDERRLLYVALTRAQARVTLSHANAREDGRPTTPSLFLSELDPKLVRTAHTRVFETSFDRVRLLKPPSATSPKEEKEFLNNLFLAQGLSPTALGNYRTCSWKYFYVNLLRIPEPLSFSQCYGTAVHEALKGFFTVRAKGKEPGVPELLRLFERAFRRLPLTEREIKDGILRAKRAFPGWYRARRASWPTQSASEFSITVPFSVFRKTFPLHGRLDRIDFTAEGVSVTDYKTGKPQSRGTLEGKTKDTRRGYKRQLVFYKLLLDRFDRGHLRMNEGVIDFVEPDEHGKYRREIFEILKEEVSSLEDEIKTTAKEIIDLSFWDKRCDDRDCKYCGLHRNLDKVI